MATSALRYYDELGLVRPTAREGGQRRYGEDAVRQVGVVLLLRELDFATADRSASPPLDVGARRTIESGRARRADRQRAGRAHGTGALTRVPEG